MTEREAVNILQLNTPFVASKEANEAMNMAIEALEKQIAKKPVGLKKNICPNCPWHIVGSYQTYCSDCGQRLNWEEV